MRLTSSFCRRLVAGLALLFFTGAAGLNGQILLPTDCATAVNSPADVSIHLTLDKLNPVFRRGEIIGFNAAYAVLEDAAHPVAPPGEYMLNTRNYDRSGRLNGMETFCVEPANGTDPLGDYFSEFVVLGGGGMFGVRNLNAVPFSMHFELNEWLSLPPGKYRLSVISQRVTRASEKVVPGIGVAPMPVRSDSVEFEVVAADPRWQAEELDSADRTLDSTASDGDKEHAARILRFLGSEASTRDLARRYWSDSTQPLGWQMAAGLYGSPYRATAIGAMKEAIRDPLHPVTRDFVDTLVRLELVGDPDYKLPPFDPRSPDRQQMILAQQSAFQRFNAEFQKRESGYLSDAMTALPAKVGEARAVTLSELLQSKVTATPEANAQMRKMLLDSWATLPLKLQNELMEYRWEEVGGKEWLPLMLQIATREGKTVKRIDTLDRGAALQRVYELAPGKGRELLLKEIGEAKGDIWIDVLGLLPDKELPQFDGAFGARLKAGRQLDVQLLDRYASVAVLPQAQAAWADQHGTGDCDAATAMLRYFLRVSPDYGVEQAEDWIRAQSHATCGYYLIGLGQYIRLPKLEQFIIDTLNNPSLPLEEDAAEALRQYGSARAEQPLWTRLEALHEKWKHKPLSEFHPHPGTIEPNLDEGLERALVQALANAQGWFLTEDKIRRLKALSSEESRLGQLSVAESILEHSELEIWLYWSSPGGLHYHVGLNDGVGMSALKEKLAEVPAGFHLKVTGKPAFLSDHKADVDEVVAAAKANGQSVEIVARE